MQDTKASLPESIEPAPLHILPDGTLRGQLGAVVLLPVAQERLSEEPASLLEFMQASPLASLDGEVALQRDLSPTRKLSL